MIFKEILSKIFLEIFQHKFVYLRSKLPRNFQSSYWPTVATESSANKFKLNEMGNNYELNFQLNPTKASIWRTEDLYGKFPVKLPWSLKTYYVKIFQKNQLAFLKLSRFLLCHKIFAIIKWYYIRIIWNWKMLLLRMNWDQPTMNYQKFNWISD